MLENLIIVLEHRLKLLDPLWKLYNSLLLHQNKILGSLHPGKPYNCTRTPLNGPRSSLKALELFIIKSKQNLGALARWKTL